MKSLLGLAESKSFGTLERASYERVATEYYDERYHPTCSDFRNASRIYLERLFALGGPSGRLADIGCGRSLISEYTSEGLVLVDDSPSMLDLNGILLNKRKINVVEAGFGHSEFDWIFAILADPYNEIGAWTNIAKALKPTGQCLFVVPSHRWASKFRASAKAEVAGKARFDLRSGEVVFLPSVILTPGEQRTLISSAGLRVDRLDHIYVGDLPEIRSAKISTVLNGEDALLDIYQVHRT